MIAGDSKCVYPSVEWLSDVERLRYSDYWNSEAEERTKPFWVLGGNFGAMESYLAEIGLPAQLHACARVAKERFGRTIQGIGCDLGAGSLWAVPHLLKLGPVEKIYCVEYSRHRLLKLGPVMLEHYQVAADRVVLALGDLHEVRLPPASCDFMFLSASFHHSDQPAALLAEIRRVLKPTGVVLIIGEHIAHTGLKARLKHMVKFVVARLPSRIQERVIGRQLSIDRFFATEADLLASDDELGDHSYTSAQYSTLFTSAGFRVERLRHRDWGFQAFVLAP